MKKSEKNNNNKNEKNLKKNEKNESRVKSFFQQVVDTIFLSGLNLFLFVSLTIIISSFLFFFKIKIGIYNVVIALISSLIISFYFNKKKIINNIIGIVISIIILMFSMYICKHTYDITWDGNTYHKLAIGLLKDGYNPVYETPEEFIKSKKASFDIQTKEFLWVQHYPKASWIFNANMYKITKNIETSKVFGMLLIYITFCFSLSFFYKKIIFLLSFIMAVLLAMNPVSIPQAFSNYVDGSMGLLLFIIIISLVSITINIEKEEKNPNNKLEWLIMAMAIIICINLKFTGLVYSGMFCASFFLLWISKAYKTGDFKLKTKNYLIYYIVVVLISLLIVGNSSYLTNTISKHNPLYPLIGKDKQDIITNNSPKSFSERNAVDKFFTSMYGVPSNITILSSSDVPKTRLPFKTNKEEIKKYSIPDVRISGFGVFFSGIFTISICFIVYYLIKFCLNKEYAIAKYIICFLVVSTILVLITDGSWWARYTPYIYLLPLLVCYLLAMNKKLISKLACLIILALIVANNYLILDTTIDTHIYQYKIINPSMIKMKKISDKIGYVDVSLRNDSFSSLLYNFKDKKINVKNHKDVSTLKKPRYVNYYFYDELTTNSTANKEKVKK